MRGSSVREVVTLQNAPLGTLLLHAYASEYSKSSGGRGPTLPKTMPVLPMLYHADTVEAIHAMQRAGGLMRFLRASGAPILGLRHRTVAMAEQTFDALALGFAAGVLRFDSDTAEIRAVAVQGLPHISDDEDLKMMAASARRLGWWFSEVSLTEMCVLLDLTF